MKKATINNMVKVILIFVFLIISNKADSQIDTIKLSDMKSTSIPILSTKKDLFIDLGEPSSIIHNNYMYIFKSDDMAIDSIFNFNTLLFQNGISFIEKNGKVRLQSIDFKKNKKISIDTPKFKLSRNLTLNEILNKYGYTTEKIENTSYIHIDPSTKSHKIVKCLRFSTGENDNIYIYLYFSSNGKLRQISIDSFVM